MNHYASGDFWKLYGKLPEDVQTQADKQHRLLEENPSHPSLQFKPVGNYWSARVNDNHRALAIKVDDGYLWFWIGNHDDYMRMIRNA